MAKTVKNNNTEALTELGALVNLYCMLKNVGTTPTAIQKLDSLIETTLDRVQ
jgi:hypothetical protein